MSDVQSFVDYDPKTDNITYTTVQDRMPILEENYARKVGAAAAPMGQGLGRKVASIDMVTVHNAWDEGYDLFKKEDLYAFLKAHPEYVSAQGRITNKGIDSGRDGKIIIK